LLDRERAAPWNQIEAQTDPDRSAAPLVVVAEDDEASRAALLEILSDAGYRAIGVPDGLALLEISSRLRPAAVIADLAMPRLDGIEAVSALRKDPRTEGTRIIAVTASWLADRGDLLAEAGFDGGLRKPFTADRLLAELRRVLALDPLEQGVAV
jgi:CheY-like chemotaxis protein